MSNSAWSRRAKAPARIRPQSFLRRPSLFLLAGTGLLLLGMLAGFYLFFPAETLRQRIIREVLTRSGVEVQIGQVALYPILSLDAKRIKLNVTGLPRPLEFEHLKLAPEWSTLLSADPGAQLQAHTMDGSITVNLQRSGAINAAATGLHFDVPLQQPMACNLLGILNKATLSSSIRLDSGTKTSVSLQLASVTILGLEIFKEDSRGFTLGDINLELDGLGRALRINTLTAKGGDLEVNGGGTLQVGRTSATSRIKLALQVRPGPQADPAIASLLQLAGEPGPDGRYALQLTGTLARPLLQPGE